MSPTTTQAHRVSVRHTEDSSTWSCKCGAITRRMVHGRKFSELASA